MKLAGGVYVYEPFGLIVTVPFVGWLNKLAVSGLFCGSVSLVSTLPDTGVPEIVLAMSDWATGGNGVPTAVKLVVAVAQPTPLQAVAMTVFEPGATLTAQLHEPPAVAVVVQRVVPSGLVKVTMLPGVAVPAITGVVVAVVLLGPLIVMLGGVVTVKLVTTADEACEPFTDPAKAVT